MQTPEALVLMTDFGLRDGAVSAMKGVAMKVSHNLPLFDITHEIPPFNVWEGAYRLLQTAHYWRPGTVFVAVVDPGVGTQRRSVAVRSSEGHIFVCPDNGLLTLILERYGLNQARQIDEDAQRLPGSSASHTFLGRDLYAFVGAKIAARQLRFEDVGDLLGSPLISLPYQHATLENGVLYGNIPVLDVQYGNVWTNIGLELLEHVGWQHGDLLRVEVFEGEAMRYAGHLPFERSFGRVEPGGALVYVNSLLQVALAANRSNFAREHGLSSGPEWRVQLERVRNR